MKRRLASRRWQGAAIVALAVGLSAGTAQAQVLATGGTITRYRENGTNWLAHIFTNSAAGETLTFTTGADVEYLIVAGGGGGGGGYQGGGGGAGGVRLGSFTATAGVQYGITVGAGGYGARWSGAEWGSNGFSSAISTSGVTSASATGGGRGSSESPSYSAAVGGSGGGGGHGGSLTGASPAGGGELGSKGGDSTDPSGFPCGGGGGARLPGGDATVANTPGIGGAGTNLTFSGVSVTYATGGKGGWRTATYAGAAGAANTGDGGEGGGGGNSDDAKGGNGGSGIVIVRYVDGRAYDPTVVATLASARWPFTAGAFTISRTNSEEVIVVAYTLSGSASNAVHYAAQPATNDVNIVPLSGFATLPVGVLSVVVDLYPLNHPLSSLRTATMTLTGSAGSPATDTVNFPRWDVGTATRATSQTVTEYNENGTNFTAHLFTNSAAGETLTLNVGGEVEYLVVAGGGGGGGGWNGGGGGAGGIRLDSITLPAGAYTITVGAGGPGTLAPYLPGTSTLRPGGEVAGSNGLPSVISAAAGVVVATVGGGRGGAETPNQVTGDGGSGGGNGGSGGGKGLAVGGDIGNDGGTGNQQVCAGGGGAGSVGEEHAGAIPGNGGSGTNLTFSGVSVEYAKGGKGGLRTALGYTGAHGAANTGMGGEGSGGGSSFNKSNGEGGKGGSGIVIVRYVTPPPAGTVLQFR